MGLNRVGLSLVLARAVVVAAIDVLLGRLAVGAVAVGIAVGLTMDLNECKKKHVYCAIFRRQLDQLHSIFLRVSRSNRIQIIKST